MEIQAASAASAGSTAEVLRNGQPVAGVVLGTPVALQKDEAKSLKYTASGAKNLAKKIHAWTNTSNNC